jgi:hypothetical protein
MRRLTTASRAVALDTKHALECLEGMGFPSFEGIILPDRNMDPSSHAVAKLKYCLNYIPIVLLSLNNLSAYQELCFFGQKFLPEQDKQEQEQEAEADPEEVARPRTQR